MTQPAGCRAPHMAAASHCSSSINRHPSPLMRRGPPLPAGPILVSRNRHLRLNVLAKRKPVPRPAPPLQLKRADFVANTLRIQACSSWIQIHSLHSEIQEHMNEVNAVAMVTQVQRVLLTPPSEHGFGPMQRRGLGPSGRVGRQLGQELVHIERLMGLLVDSCLRYACLPACMCCLRCGSVVSCTCCRM